MDLFKQGMKGPTRPAPSVPSMGVTRYSPVTNWNDDPFGADVFEPNPMSIQKKKPPPPRPPPPRVGSKPPDVPVKPSHFLRKPTVLSTLLSRSKNKATVPNPSISSLASTEVTADVDTHRMFPKCEPKNLNTGTLIDLSSPPSSPTFTTRSSSDGLSVDSFGSDATTSTNHHNVINGGNASQAESGFEDDFDLFLHSRKAINKDDTFDDFTSIDPFSPQPVTKPPVMKKPVINRDLFDVPNNTSSQPVTGLKGPTIIRAKPTRPKPPDNSALLKNTFGSNFPVTSMFINTTTPIQKVSGGYGDSLDSKLVNWDEESSPERESSPPMPRIPPPPPPPVAEGDFPTECSADIPADFADKFADFAGFADEDEAPYAVALFDYFTDHPEDLCFSTNTKIRLIRRVDNEWLFGRLHNGAEGLFPANYVEIKVPLPGETAGVTRLGTAVALYDFEPVQPGDLRFIAGDVISVISQLNEQWYFGECNGLKGQFPANYVQMS